MTIMVSYLQVNELLKLFNEFLQVDKEREKEKYALYFSSEDILFIYRDLLFLLDNDRQRWKRIYVEGPATGTVVKELFGTTIDVLDAESGGSESLADFIIKGNGGNVVIN